MKKYFSILASLAFLTAVSCTSSKNACPVLDLSLEGVEDGLELMITDAADFDFEPISTATLSDGKAQFTLPSKDPRVYRIVASEYKGAAGSAVVALSAGEKASVKASAKIEDNQFGYTDFILSDVKVEGSKTNEQFLANIPDRDSMDKEYEAFQEKNKEVLEKINNITRGTAEWVALEQTPEWKTLEADEKAFFDKVEATIEGAISNNSDNWMAPYFMLTEYSYLTTESNLEQYMALSDDVKESYYGKKVAEMVVPMSQGNQMPDFSFTDKATGEQMSLLDICKQNKYVLIDFWASWCKPCRNEIPNFKNMYEKYHEQGFQIVSISADSKEKDWLKALEEEKLPWPNDIDGEKGICKMYNVQFYPTVYLLDSKGKMIASNEEVRGENLQNKLKELFDY